jgi:hypothetical protein
MLALDAAAFLAPSRALAQESPRERDDTPDEAPWSAVRGRALAASTAHFRVYVPANGSLDEWAGPVAAAAETVLPTVEARLGQPLRQSVDLVLAPAAVAPEACPPRAAAMPTRRRIVLFAGPATLEPKALAAFLAHELGHQLTWDRWHSLGHDRRLAEGIATWASEPYWLVWRGWSSLDAVVAELQAAGALAPLPEPRPGCLLAAERDVYYSAWASFVDFLLRRYGWDRFAGIMSLPAAAEDLADYLGAYGRSLEALSAEWEAEIRARPGTTDSP